MCCLSPSLSPPTPPHTQSKLLRVVCVLSGVSAALFSLTQHTVAAAPHTGAQAAPVNVASVDVGPATALAVGVGSVSVAPVCLAPSCAAPASMAHASLTPVCSVPACMAPVCMESVVASSVSVVRRPARETQ